MIMAMKEEGHIYYSFKENNEKVSEKIMQVFKIYLKNNTISTINNNLQNILEENYKVR